jgi:hypothetical protein
VSAIPPVSDGFDCGPHRSAAFLVVPHYRFDTSVRFGKLENGKSTRRCSVQELIDEGAVKPSVVRDQIRRGLVYGWYFLPASEPNVIAESIVDLREIHTVSRLVLEKLIFLKGNFRGASFLWSTFLTC